jgi:hypothetical protein
MKEAMSDIHALAIDGSRVHCADGAGLGQVHSVEVCHEVHFARRRIDREGPRTLARGST